MPPLQAPGTQPPHPAYRPHGAYDRPTAQVGGPRDAPQGFSVPDHGAPPPPPPRGYGWNGPPPPGGWNRPWNGPPRDEATARSDFGPFAYNTFTATPVFNSQFGGWGYWFFGDWIPLY